MNKKKGFTLVEILAVVIILGIISVIVYPVLNKVLKDNRKRAFEASLNAVARAAELYKTDNNNTLGVIDYDDGTIDMSNLGKWKSGTLTDRVDSDGLTKVYLAGFYDGEFCAKGFENNFTITEGKCIDTPDLCFMLEDNTITNYGFNYSACPIDINIPTSILGEDVLYIGEGVFESSNVSSVIIPNSILEIRDNAFYDSSLTSLDLSNSTSLEYIGYQAFEDTYLGEVNFTNLTNLEYIDEDAFATSNLLGTVDLSKSLKLTGIGEEAFDSNQISSVKLSNLPLLAQIDDYAFGYNNLTGTLDLSNLPVLTNIGEGVFSSNDISSVNFTNIPNLEEIEDYAFEDNSITGTLNLKSLPNLLYIEEDVFRNNSISSVDFTGTNLLQSIDSYAFGDNSIQTLTFDPTNNIQYLGSWSFANNNLQSLDLSMFTKLTDIGPCAFNNNQLPDSKAFIYNMVDGVTDISILISYGGANRSSITIPNSVVTIGENSMSHQNITGINISSSVTTIEPYALSYNDLTSVSIPTNVINIGNSAFYSNRILQGNAIINNPPISITLDATAFNNNGASKNTNITPTFVYEDTVNPVLTMIGDSTLTIEAGSTYVDPGATAIDNIDGDITGNITTVSTINTSILGTYSITYNISDYIGNISTATRTVNVVDTTAPVIVINGSNPTTASLNKTYNDAGATVTDNLDQNLVATVTGTVDTSTLGTYTITYTATDSHGNVATAVTRTVNVVDYIYYTLTNKLPVYGIAGATTYPQTGWTSIQNGSADDNYVNVPLPFSVNMYGTAYSSVYVSSNTYITFGSGATNYSSLSNSNPAYNKLLFGGADNSYQRVSYYSTEKYVRIRYEGSASTSGTAGSPTIVAEITIFNPTYTKDNATMIEMLVGNHSRTSGAATIANATGSLYTNYTLAASTSYIFLGDSSGNGFQVFSGAQATNIDY